jgi:hypothetical protein
MYYLYLDKFTRSFKYLCVKILDNITFWGYLILIMLKKKLKDTKFNRNF